MKYFARFTIKDTTSGETRECESNRYEDIKEAQNVMNNYLKKQTNYLNIKMLGNNSAKVEKFGGYILIEILKEN